VDNRTLEILAGRHAGSDLQKHSAIKKTTGSRTRKSTVERTTESSIQGEWIVTTSLRLNFVDSARMIKLVEEITRLCVTELILTITRATCVIENRFYVLRSELKISGYPIKIVLGDDHVATNRTTMTTLTATEIAL